MFGDGIIASFVTLLIVIGVLWLSYVGTRLVSGGMKRNQKTSKMKVIDRIGVGQNQSLLLVQIGDKFFFVGTTPNSITLLSELPETMLEDLLSDRRDEKQEFEEFSHILDKFKKRKR